jgi:hypothetical protein
VVSFLNSAFFSAGAQRRRRSTAVMTSTRGPLFPRGPLSNERLEILEDGTVKLKLKTPWHDGTSHLLLTPSEFLEKLSAIVSSPRAHLVKWGIETRLTFLRNLKQFPRLLND